MKDKIINFFLIIGCYFRYIFKIKSKSRPPINLKKYKLTFSELFLENELNTDVWQRGQIWGDFHPKFLHQYYGITSEFINVKEGYLNLYTHYKPMKFYDFKNNINITIPYGVGLVISKSLFSYGYFEVTAKLPKGKLLWPAIWLSNFKTWPPEIDILEGYSKGGNYENSSNFKNFKLQPNVHYGHESDGSKSSYGAENRPIFNALEREITYGLVWTNDAIKIYYDGYKVFQTKDKKILKYFNIEDNAMEIILNNSLESIASKEKLHSSVFKIKSVKYYQPIF